MPLSHYNVHNERCSQCPTSMGPFNHQRLGDSFIYQYPSVSHGLRGHTVISRSDRILATLPPFAANILWLLQSQSAHIFSSTKERDVLMKVKETVTEEGEDIEEIGEGNEDEDEDV